MIPRIPPSATTSVTTRPTTATPTQYGAPVTKPSASPAPFPLFLAIGWIYQRRADALDAAFRELADQP